MRARSVLGRRAVRVTRSELNSLRERKFAGEIDRVGLAPHVLLPTIASAFAAAAGIFFAAERTANFRAAGAGVDVRDSTIAADRAHEFFRFAHVVGENRTGQTLR